MGCDVYANGDEIACKAGSGKVIASFPDVCLTPPPPPAGPIPIPYPDTSFSKDMQNGSKTVMIEGKEVMLKDQSFYKTSPLGDEAATNGQGANVVTHVITGKTYFVAWSMDVKFEDQNVDRHTDMTTSNHACPPAGAAVPNLNAAKPTKGTQYKNQTCEDDELKYVNDEKDNMKVELTKTPSTNPNKYSRKALKEGALDKIKCSDLKKRVKDRETMVAARELEESECFANGPVKGDAKSEKKGKDHHDQLNDHKDGLVKDKARMAINCAPGHAMAGQ